MPLPLIDKKDNFELIRDEIAAILAAETINQQALATEAGKDPDLWKFTVYRERSRPWELLDESENTVFPIVNVWYEGSDYDLGSSLPALKQAADPSIFNIDIYATSLNEKLVVTGYITADKKSALDCQRIIRLIRNILYSVPPDSTEPGQNYTFFNLHGIVGSRHIQSISRFFIDYDKQAIPSNAARIVLAVRHVETALEGPYENLNLLQIDTTFNETGLVQYEFDQT